VRILPGPAAVKDGSPPTQSADAALPVPPTGTHRPQDPPIGRG
jgi:hypothetical protein